MFVSTVLVTVLAAGMVSIAGGEYRPLYMKPDSELFEVADFQLDSRPVTNHEFSKFVRQSPQWAKGSVPAIFAEQGYLAHWVSKGESWQPKASELQNAVVNVSWFAADAYCRSQSRRLPTVAEWEYVARASETLVDGSQDSEYNQRILDWYARPTGTTRVGQSPANYWGVEDMHGLIWEWVQDFNSALTSGESRADSSINTDLYCAAASSGAADPSDYAAFMRYGFRSSLSATFAINNLGFRCARDLPQESSL